MILGRSTVQWTALITATLDFILVVIGVMFVDLVGPATILLSGLGGLLGVYILFLANTSTTPTGDPQLKAGTMVRVTDDSGTVIGHEPVPTPPMPAMEGGAAPDQPAG